MPVIVFWQDGSLVYYFSEINILQDSQGAS